MSKKLTSIILTTLTFLVLCLPAFSATFSSTDPSGTHQGPVNIVVDAAAEQGKTITNLKMWLDDNVVMHDYWCNGTMCHYDYEEQNGFLMDVAHGTYTVRFTADEDGVSVSSDPTTLVIDKTPTISLSGPVGNVSRYFKLTGSVHFQDYARVPFAGWGWVYIYVDDVYIGRFDCTGQDYVFDTLIGVTTTGRHVLKAIAVPALQNITATTETTFYVEQILPTENPTQNICNPDLSFCWNSSANAATGEAAFDIPLLLGNGKDFYLNYRSKDELTAGYESWPMYPYSTPLGTGWSHSYDLSLFTNPDGTVILKGEGRDKHFYTPSGGGTFVSRIGDSSILVKNPDTSYTLTHRDGTKHLFSWDGYLYRVVDRDGNITEVYDNHRWVWKAITITDPHGRVTTIQYTYGNSRILWVVDPDLQQYDFSYDNSGNVIEILFPAPAAGGTRPSWKFTYNSWGALVTKTDPSGNVTSYSYDTATHKVVGSTNPEGLQKSMSYGSGGAVLTREDGGNWSRGVDPVNGVVTSDTDPNGNTVSYGYNAAGLLETQVTPIDANTSYVKSYQYDSYGNQTDIQGHVRHAGPPVVDDAVDYHVGYTFDNANFDQVTSITDYISGLTTTVVYDTDGVYKRVQITVPGEGLTTVRKNSNGTVNDIVFPDGKTLDYVYNSSKLLQSVTDNLGIKTEYSNFTASGKPQTVKVFDSAGTVKATTNILYDNLGRVASTTMTGGTDYVTTYGYDASGNVTVVTDANGNPTSKTFNYKGQTKQITDALGKVTTITYSPTLLPASLIDANGNETAFSYDLMGQLIKETPPVGVAFRYEYNIAGQITKKINDSTNEVLVSYSYSPQGRLIGRSYLDGASDAFTYSTAGQLATASNQSISYAFGYDSVGRLQSQTDSFGNAVAYTYDTAGRRTSSTTNGSHTVAYGYSNGNLSSITSNLAGAFGFGYDTLGRRASLTYPNGVVGTYSYNADQPSWLAGISYQGALPIYSVSYPTFDKVGNRTSKNDGTAISYGYDAVYRLLAAAGEAFTYDDAGNRLTDAARLYTVTAGNVLAAAGADAFTYDSFGNTTGKNAWIYSWNSAGQLVGASNGTTAASYAYDPFGRRISKTVNGATTSYVYDGQDIAATASAGATAYFVHGPGTDEHLAATAAGQVSFYHSDGLGSITRITDTAQAVVGSISYDSFGNATVTGIAQPYGFTGRELDTETGLMFYRARYYDPTTGRFISRDPLGLTAGDVVTSNYVGGNPVNATDPSGLIGLPNLDYNVSFGFLEFSGKLYGKNTGFFPAHDQQIPNATTTVLGFSISHTVQKHQLCGKPTSEGTIGWKNFGISSDKTASYIKYNVGAEIGLPGYNGLGFNTSTSLENVAINSANYLSKITNFITPYIEKGTIFLVRGLK